MTFAKYTLLARPKLSAVEAAPRTSLRELTALPRPSSLLPPYQEPLPRSRPSASNFTNFLGKFLAKPMGSVSNQNCCKGFRFKEKLEKYFFIP